MSEVYDHDRALELLLLAREGDEEAREALVVNNVALVRSVVKKFLGRGVEYDDLYQIGCMGLVKAIDNFDASYNVRFSTYAVPMIAGEIKRFLRDDGIVKVSRSLKELAAKAAACEERLKRELKREPTVEEIAAAAETTPEELVFAREAAKACRSLHEPVFEEEGLALIDRLPAEEKDDSAIDRILLKDLLATLDARERSIIFLRYFKDETQSSIARRLGISQVQVSRLESRILKKMREKAAP